MKRGDVVICVLKEDCGKPRLAVIVQSDLFNETHASLVVCPITSNVVDAPLFRLTLEPNSQNSLEQKSQIMVDKMRAVKRERISSVIGHLSLAEQRSIDQALSRWLTVNTQQPIEQLG